MTAVASGRLRSRRLQTFFEPADYQRYIELVADGCAKADVDVFAYCLMPNHVHLILVPKTEMALNSALGVAHQKYSWAINRRQGWTGFLWQQRFFSAPMDDAYARRAVAYVELNPVRARLVAEPEQWRWSSAPAHVADAADRLVKAARPAFLNDIVDWRAFLASGVDPDSVDRLRRETETGRGVGSEAWLSTMEKSHGVVLRAKPRGRPRQAKPDREKGAELLQSIRSGLTRSGHSQSIR